MNMAINKVTTVKYVPQWFPGAGFKKVANYYRGLQDPVRDEPVKAVQNAMVCVN